MVRFLFSVSVAFIPFLAIVSSLQAEVKLHGLFTDNGILQRGVKAPIWGTVDKPDLVTVTFGEQTVTATPEQGKWKVELAPLEASNTPRDLIVKQAGETVVRKNVVVGDLWICGGQSNMQWSVKQADGTVEALKTAPNPSIRLFTVDRRETPEPRTELESGAWVEASPKTISDFSAVGYYFGRDLQTALHVPIGLISCNMNGSAAERWILRRTIETNSEINDMSTPQGVAGLYNAMLAPLAPMAIKGAIWYQGEANARRPYNYRHVLTALIKNWRETFGQGDFPFLVVELAPHSPENVTVPNWAVERESQQWVAKHSPNVATISIVDIGHPTDIHPPEKRPVGARLAIAARALAYGEKITPSGPQYESVTFDGNRAIVKFKNIGEGLLAKDGELKGFILAGEDQKFFPAQAKIEGDTVIVSSNSVPHPKSVRLGWENYPVVNLWNKDDLPAHPFRTDDWEVSSQYQK